MRILDYTIFEEIEKSSAGRSKECVCVEEAERLVSLSG
jgi:hypothetical protein